MSILECSAALSPGHIFPHEGLVGPLGDCGLENNAWFRLVKCTSRGHSSHLICTHNHTEKNIQNQINKLSSHRATKSGWQRAICAALLSWRYGNTREEQRHHRGLGLHKKRKKGSGVRLSELPSWCFYIFFVLWLITVKKQKSRWKGISTLWSKKGKQIYPQKWFNKTSAMLLRLDCPILSRKYLYVGCCVKPWKSKYLGKCTTHEITCEEQFVSVQKSVHNCD